MYKCAITGKLSQPGEQAYKIITETRPKEYRYPDGHLIATGTEIVKEIIVCREEFLKHQKEKSNAADVL